MSTQGNQGVYLVSHREECEELWSGTQVALKQPHCKSVPWMDGDCPMSTLMKTPPQHSPDSPKAT